MKTKQSVTNYGMRSFVSFAKQYRWRFVPVFITFVIANVALALVPLFIGRLIGSLSQVPANYHMGLVYVIVLIALSTLHDWVWRLGEFLYMRLINPLSFAYETLVFKQLVSKPYPYFVDKFTGKLSSYTSNLGKEFRDLLEALFWNYTSEFVTMITVIGILLTINVQTGLIFIANIILMIVVGRILIRRNNLAEKTFTDAQSTKNARVIDIIANFTNVKSFRTEAKEASAVGQEQAITLEASRRSFIWSILFWGSMSFFVRNVIWPVTIAYNFYLFKHHQISLGDFAALLSTILLFSNFIWEVVWNVSQFSLRFSRIEEAHNYLFGSENVGALSPETVKLKSVPELKKQLDVHDLSFAYPDNPDIPVLSAIKLSVAKGEKVGIVGKSGSGKSTLTKLLLGYYDSAEGSLRVDGKALTGSALVDLISFVPQDTSLFHRTIAENIAYATDRDVTLEEVIVAAKRAHADEFIQKIPERYDAMVGERGVKLSAGQRQRIAIARAYLDNKPILIMDEATSALDSESEVLIQRALEALWQDKTVIAIAHRLSTLRNMDRIVVMDNGKIVEQGSHEHLLKHKGIYAMLWQHQSGGFIED
ncbi:MAG: putative transport protein superfamily, bind [Candidatus Saccharibacteria bacterium]|nr:putative transport protein superfamily, bind [Candidatus Saccharibacteria bacterium]